MVRWYRLWTASDQVSQMGHVDREAVASSVATIWSGPIDTSSSRRPSSVGSRLVARLRVLGIAPNRTGHRQGLHQKWRRATFADPLHLLHIAVETAPLAPIWRQMTPRSMHRCSPR